MTAVSVCTPTPSHADITVRALSAGKHVLLEKPIALTLEDAARIAAAAEKSDRVVMVAQVVRFFEGYASLLNIATSGELGEVRAVRASRALAKPQWAPWWPDHAQSGGPLVDFSIHDFDQANLFLGVPIAVTATQSGTDGPYEITIEYRDGGVAQILSHPFLPQASPFTSTIDVAGTQGMASYRLIAGAPTDGGEGTNLSEITKTTPVGVTRIDVSDNRPYTQEVAYFLDCIRKGTRPARSDVRSSMVALSVSLAARTSLETGAKVLVG